MGSGTTAIAALETGRTFAGFDLFPEYIEMAKRRVSLTRVELEKGAIPVPGMAIPSRLSQKEFSVTGDFQRMAREQGVRAQQMAKDLLETCGFTIVESPKRFSELGVEVNVLAESKDGRQYFFDISGAFSGDRPGLRRTDTLWKALGKACVLHVNGKTAEIPYMLITTDKPIPGSSGDKALKAIQGDLGPICGVFEMWDEEVDCRILWEIGHGKGDLLSTCGA